ncbi:MAG: hypothetical protein J0I09_09060 [Sphingobacteriia bacterium]|nr:hypothetical protein [Sphingobacteriia bacterium]
MNKYLELLGDAHLLHIARKRIWFKRSLLFYIVVMLFCLGSWYFGNGTNAYFWPKWPAFSLAIFLFMFFMEAYVFTKYFSIIKEYQTLKHQSL